MSGIYYRHTSTTASRLVDGETVIVSLPLGEMTILNGSGSFVWSIINGENNVAKIENIIVNKFSLPSPPAIRGFLNELLSHNLIEAVEQPSFHTTPPPPTISSWEEPAIQNSEVLEALAGFCGSAFDGVDPCRIDDITCDAVFD